jgi:hypothetical protein
LPARGKTASERLPFCGENPNRSVGFCQVVVGRGAATRFGQRRIAGNGTGAGAWASSPLQQRLLNARQALAAGRAVEAREMLESARTEIGSQPLREGNAAQLDMSSTCWTTH